MPKSASSASKGGRDEVEYANCFYKFIYCYLLFIFCYLLNVATPSFVSPISLVERQSSSLPILK